MQSTLNISMHLKHLEPVIGWNLEVKGERVDTRGDHQTAQITLKSSAKWHNHIVLQVTVYRITLHRMVQCSLRFYNMKTTQTALHRTISIY